jgi:hypothetical protein
MANDQVNVLISLAYKCPFDLGCLSCPLDKLRTLPISERIKVLESLPYSECKEILIKHYQNYQKNFDPSNFKMLGDSS